MTTARCEELLLEALRLGLAEGTSGGQSARTPIDRGGLGLVQLGEPVRGGLGTSHVGTWRNSCSPAGLRQR